MVERIVLSGPLSTGSSFRLVVDGDWTVKECNRVLAILDVVVGHLREDKQLAEEAEVDAPPPMSIKGEMRGTS